MLIIGILKVKTYKIWDKYYLWKLYKFLGLIEGTKTYSGSAILAGSMINTLLGIMSKKSNTSMTERIFNKYGSQIQWCTSENPALGGTG